MQTLDAIRIMREYREWSRTLDERMGPISLMTIDEWRWKDFQCVLTALHDAYLSPSPKMGCVTPDEIRRYQRLNRKLGEFLTSHPAYCPPVLRP